MGKETFIGKIKLWIAWHVPRWLAYWCTVRVGTTASQDLFNSKVPGITVIEALECWRNK